MKPTITGMTLSLLSSDKEYGKGDEAFVNLTANWPAEGLPFEQLDEALDCSLIMFHSLWLSILAQRFSAKKMSGDEFKAMVAELEKRFPKVRNYYRKAKDAEEQTREE